MMLKILTWNIHKGIGGVDRRYKLERTIDAIRIADADLVLLQEVADGWSGAGGDFQAELIREALGYQYVTFDAEHRFKTGGYGNAILSRHPLHECHHIDLTLSWRKKRGAQLAKVAVRHEGHQHTVAVANMHLGLAGSERETQLKTFFESEPFKGIHSSTPIILGGDLNDLYGSLGPKLIEPEGFQRLGSLQSTFPAFFPIRPLDGLFVRGASHKEASIPDLGPLKSASDHLPILGKFRLT